MLSITYYAPYNNVLQILLCHVTIAPFSFLYILYV